MDKKELASMLKPIIKECVKECLLESSGILSHIITETIQGMKKELLQEVKYVETSVPTNTNKSLFGKHSFSPPTQQMSQDRKESKMQQLMENKKRMLDSIAKTNPALSNVFENVEPIRTGGHEGDGSPMAQAKKSPLSGLAPDDPGVDISALFNFGK